MTPEDLPLETVPVLGIGVARGRGGGEVKRGKIVATMGRRGRMIRCGLESIGIQRALRSRGREVEQRRDRGRRG